MNRFHLTLILLFLFTSVFIGTVRSEERFVRTQLLMGNIPVSITIETAVHKREKAFQVMERAFAEAKRIEEAVSEFNLSSQTSVLNQNAGRHWVPIGKDLVEILSTSAQVSEWTEGAFDITFASLDKKATYRDVLVIPELSLASLKRKGVKIGVSGIAKGYIVDRMSLLIKKEGFAKHLVNAGDIYANGRWEVPIRDPDHPQGEPLCSLQVKNRAVSTSGTYERGLHILDPRSGKPVSNLKSVTVLARSSILADSLATGGFVLGKDRIHRLPGIVSGIGILLIDSQGKVERLGRVSALCRGRSI